MKLEIKTARLKITLETKDVLAHSFVSENEEKIKNDLRQFLETKENETDTHGKFKGY